LSDSGFTITRILYMAASGLIALLGLLAAARAADTGFALFGWGLVIFGLGFAFFMMQRGLEGKPLH
jgi:hypothetical protein